MILSKPLEVAISKRFSKGVIFDNAKIVSASSINKQKDGKNKVSNFKKLIF